MTIDEFSNVAVVLAWPVTTLLLAWIFYNPVVEFLSTLTKAFTFKSLKLKVLGIEVELSPERAKSTLDELAEDIAKSTNELSEKTIELFDQILAADGRKSVQDFFPDFAHDDTNPDLCQLRALRDRKLIRPFEGHSWKPTSHPVVTPYGRIVASMRKVG